MEKRNLHETVRIQAKIDDFITNIKQKQQKHQKNVGHKT